MEDIARIAGSADHVDLGIGDDAAVLSSDGPVVACCDLLVEGVHFRRATATARDIGHKAAAVNLSDLAAMGARPRALLVGLALGPEHPRVQEMYEGMAALAAAHDAPIVGGDISAAAVTSLAVTALGDLPGNRRAVGRGGAAPGDTVWITGPLGGSAAGLRILEDDLPGGAHGDALIARHLRPTPLIAAGASLAAAGASAMIDVSDGLALDAHRMASASDVRISIDADRVPRDKGVDAVAAAAGIAPAVLACSGGEDYELLVTGPEDLGARSGLPLVAIGTVEAGADTTFSFEGKPLALPDDGWLHDV